MGRPHGSGSGSNARPLGGRGACLRPCDHRGARRQTIRRAEVNGALSGLLGRGCPRSAPIVRLTGDPQVGARCSKHRLTLPSRSAGTNCPREQRPPTPRAPSALRGAPAGRSPRDPGGEAAAARDRASAHGLAASVRRRADPAAPASRPPGAPRPAGTADRRRRDARGGRRRRRGRRLGPGLRRRPGARHLGRRDAPRDRPRPRPAPSPSRPSPTRSPAWRRPSSRCRPTPAARAAASSSARRASW